MAEEPPENITLDLCLGSPRIRERDSVSLDLSLGFSNPNLEISRAPSNEEFMSDARKIKRSKSLSEEEKDILEAQKRTGLWTELTLNTCSWPIQKTLSTSDIDSHKNRFIIEKISAESHIMRYLSKDDQNRIQEGKGVKIKVYDHDTETEHDQNLCRWVNSTRSYILNGGWVKKFVQRRHLKEGDKIGLLWDCVDSRLKFCVLSRP